MSDRFAEIAFSPKVQEHQRRNGSHRAYRRRVEGPSAGREALGPDAQYFIGARESFYMASIGESGWPYIQHRGGPEGFLRVLDEHTLAFADFRGNRQYISRGNIDHDDRVALFLMDYANQTRLKVYGRARVVETADDPALLGRLQNAEYPARVERALVIDVEASEWNCPQHIPQLLSVDDVRRLVHASTHELEERVEQLERENAALRAASVGSAG